MDTTYTEHTDVLAQLDAELTAVTTVTRTLAALTDEERARVLAFVTSRFARPKAQQQRRGK